MNSAGSSYRIDDTIAALASPPGGAARGIVRISGPQAAAIAAALVCRVLPEADRRASSMSATESNHLCSLVGATPRVCSVALRLSAIHSPLPADWFYWPSGRSYTGQEVVELHTLGSPPLLDALLTELFARGARPAQPGEFTLRAFLSGRIDLPQAEAVLGVIDAADRQQWRTAVQQLAGGLSRPAGALRDRLLDLLADIEAGLDFADEDIRFVTPQEIESRLTEALEAAARMGQQLRGRTRSDDVYRAVLVGPPNAGKSSLFNALTGGGTALISPIEGTTRDYLTARIDCAGVVWELIDTPGLSAPARIDHDASAEHLYTRPAGEESLRQSAALGAAYSAFGSDPTLCEELSDDALLRQLMLRSTMECIARADMLLLCLPADIDDAEAEREWIDLVRQCACSADRQRAEYPLRIELVRTKGDLVPGRFDSGRLVVSALTGEGISELRSRLKRTAVELSTPSGDAVASTAVRCAEAVAQLNTELASALALCRAGSGEELVAQCLRHALDALGRIVGTVFTDDLLNNIFSRFCIGK